MLGRYTSTRTPRCHRGEVSLLAWVWKIMWSLFNGGVFFLLLAIRLIPSIVANIEPRLLDISSYTPYLLCWLNLRIPNWTFCKLQFNSWCIINLMSRSIHKLIERLHKQIYTHEKYILLLVHTSKFFLKVIL